MGDMMRKVLEGTPGRAERRLETVDVLSEAA
jgi:hypothetical protein